jgi:gluconate:H+ symporter, GntP family
MNPVLIILIGVAVILFCIIKLKLHAVISLILAALVTGLMTTPELIYDFAIHKGMSETAARQMSHQFIGTRLSAAFGNTAGKVGILIALASIIGACLMKSGGAERIIRGFLRLFGKKNASLAFLSGSFTLAIPVFFDTVFYLMIPLVKSISVRDPKKFSLYLMAVMGAGVMAHSLIPPTPGPLFVAQAMGISLGAMMLGGLVVGIITTICGYIYALWANKKWNLPMRDTPDITISELKQLSQKPITELPGLWISILPILLPVLLITANTVLDVSLGKRTDLNTFQDNLLHIFSILGDANIALTISALLSLYLLWSRVKDVKQFQKFISEALFSAGVIVLITAAGGAFGEMLQQTGIGIEVEHMATGYQTAILPLAFIITAVVRTAQGSATVAMVTAIGVMSGFSSSEGLPFHPVYLALVIGCGSKIFAWMNDSAFWIITKMSGMEEKETIRHFSFLLTIMGIAGLIAVMILSYFFPFASV